MKVQVENLAKQQLIDIYYYNYQYSIKNAIEITENIMMNIDNLNDFPYIGKHIMEIENENFREIICRKSRNSGYRIIYYISQKQDKIYVLSIINGKQDFKTFLKLHNYFKNYYIF